MQDRGRTEPCLLSVVTEGTEHTGFLLLVSCILVTTLATGRQEPRENLPGLAFLGEMPQVTFSLYCLSLTVGTSTSQEPGPPQDIFTPHCYPKAQNTGPHTTFTPAQVAGRCPWDRHCVGITYDMV